MTKTIKARLDAITPALPFTFEGHAWRVYHYDAMHAANVSFDRIAGQARDVGGSFVARWDNDGALTVTIFWDADPNA